MSSPRSQDEGVHSQSSVFSISSSLKHEFSNDENVATAFPSTAKNISSVSTSKQEEEDEDEEDEYLSTSERYDISLGIATLVPVRQAPVRRLIIPPRISTHTFPVSSPSPLRPPPIPPRPGPRREVKTVPMSERITITTPQTVPAANAVGRGGEEEGEGEVVSEGSVKRPEPLESLLTALPMLPQSSRRVPDQPEKRVAVVFAPVPRQVDIKAVALPSYSAEVELEEEIELEGGESGGWDTERMRRMYSDCLAGRGAFSPERLRWEAVKDDCSYSTSIDVREMIRSEEEAEMEAEEVFDAQIEFFDLADDGASFWDPFMEMRFSDGDVDDVLDMGMSPKAKVRRPSDESIRKALEDESLHGLTPSPKIAGRNLEVEKIETAGREGAATSATAGPATDEALPEKGGGGTHDYTFKGWSSFSLEDENTEADEEDVEEQDQIINPFADQFAAPGSEWTAFLAQRRESGSSNYSAPSRLASPVPRLRGGETLLYSPIQNPWMNAFDPLSVSNPFQDAAGEFFSAVDVEALVASMQEPGYEFADTDSGKGSPEHYHLKPHRPKISCGCEFCYRHYHPTLDMIKAHDTSEWCHCFACRDFRDGKDVEKNRAEQIAAWRARLDELAAEVYDARWEEESRLLDLTDIEETDNQDELRAKKIHGWGDWVRRHLGSPSPRE